MPSIITQVQRIFVDPNSEGACVFAGPTLANTQILLLERRASDPPHTGAFKSSMLDALGHALAARHDVEITYDDNSRIARVMLR
jgi:hypothetical protein